MSAHSSLINNQAVAAAGFSDLRGISTELYQHNINQPEFVGKDNTEGTHYKMQTPVSAMPMRENISNLNSMISLD